MGIADLSGPSSSGIRLPSHPHPLLEPCAGRKSVAWALVWRLGLLLPLDYAEALINPIKHVSLMDQRAKQLAALIGESEVSSSHGGGRG